MSRPLIIFLLLGLAIAQTIDKSILFTREEYVVEPDVCRDNQICSDYNLKSVEGLTGFDTDILLSRISLTDGRVSDISRITRLRIHPTIQYSSLSAFDSQQGYYYYVPTPDQLNSDPTNPSGTSRYSILSAAGKNQLFCVDVLNGIPQAPVVLQSNGSVQALAADSTRGLLIGIINGKAVNINATTGVITTISSVFYDQRGILYWQPGFGLSAMDTQSGNMYLTGILSVTSPQVSYCEYVFRVNYLYGDVATSDCINAHIADIQFDTLAQSLFGIVKAPGGQGTSIVQLDSDSGFQLIQAQLANVTAPDRAGAFDPSTHLFYYIQISAGSGSFPSPLDPLWSDLGTGLDVQGRYQANAYPTPGAVLSSPQLTWLDTMNSMTLIAGFDVRSRSVLSQLYVTTTEILRRQNQQQFVEGLQGANFQFIDFPLDTWVDRTDSCQGQRQSSCYSQVMYVVSSNSTWIPTKSYNCPSGYRWMTSCEAQYLFTSTCGENAYYGTCGWSGSTNNGLTRTLFRFKDSWLNFAALNATAAATPSAIVTTSNTANFAGAVCTQAFSQSLRATQWMNRADSCAGFRQSECYPFVRFAVSASTIWMSNVEYLCPIGYRPMTSCEALQVFTAPCYAQTYTAALCGSSFVEAVQTSFRFSDSVVTGLKLTSTSFQTGLTTDSSFGGFAGIVCILDEPTVLPKIGLWTPGNANTVPP